jgi:L-rhamnose mutarotase
MDTHRQAENEVKRYGSLIRLRPEYEERYIILHKHTFPGVLDRIHKSNIKNYSIFLLDGLLFSYLEYIGSDYKTDMDAIAADRITKDWWKLTDPMQEPLECRKAGDWWAIMEEWFHGGVEKVPSTGVQRHAYTAVLPTEVRSEYKQKCTRISCDGIRSLSLFFLESSIYVYIEYAGKISQTNIESLLNPDKSKSWRLEWKEMKEVFHTD